MVGFGLLSFIHSLRLQSVIHANNMKLIQPFDIIRAYVRKEGVLYEWRTTCLSNATDVN